LLSKLSISFQVVESGADESIDKGLSPAGAVAVLANRKALAVAEESLDGIILAADTAIDLENRILGKPANDSDAVDMLRLLRGRVHCVVTGVTIVNKKEGLRVIGVVATEVRMRDYSNREIDDYVATQEPRDKAGAYAIQGVGGHMIESIRGCYNNVVGLPLCETTKLLRTVGFEPRSEDVCHLPSGDPCPRLREVSIDD
jgi:MAF protein